MRIRKEYKNLKSLKKLLSVLVIVFLLASTSISEAHQGDINKVRLGDTFNYFELDDVHGQRWVSSYLRAKPVIILTGHRYQKYEISKWAEAFAQEYQNCGKAHVLWVVNLSKVPWTTCKETVLQQWHTFYSSVPILMDWDGVVGKSLKVNYNVPNIIVLDSFGRLVMHEMHSYSPSVYRAVSEKIAPFCSYLTCKTDKWHKGRKGNSY